ncbi:MAG: aldehyde ferredoxin oxidoreductase N-terminal domain-containing protein, partial [Anaerolineae bacterium]|nr:aldehyde ferredoxin oxidoreductase N-terminal domain-containing protein [Anaerolineae bacterium]
MYGWTGRILDVDLCTGEISTRDGADLCRDYIGGRALAARLAWDELLASADAFDPANRIFIATGPLTGTLAPTAGRTIMSGLSPRTYPRAWYTHSTLGGWFGPALKYAGYDAVVIRGRAASPVYLDIHDHQARLCDAADLWGRGARDTQLALLRRLGDRAQVLAIGPAGENRVRFATVQHAEENAAGHSGFGAVWGAKNLKAIAARGSGGVAVADPPALLREVLTVGTFRATPCVAAIYPPQALRERRPVCSQACTFNCTAASFAEGADGRLRPLACVGRVWIRRGGMAATSYSGGGITVPPASNFGSREVGLHELCNDLGLDLWFRLVMQPWFIRCRELGVDAIRSQPVEPEDPAWFEGFMHQLARRQGLGAIFAEDLRRAVDELQGELPEELILLGRELEFDFGFPAHREGRFWDEEPLPFWVISAMMHASEGRDPTIG